MAPKTIRSQYHSTCRVCEKHIRPGDMISWARGEKPAHVECVEQPAAQPQQPTLQQLTRERDALASDGQNLRRMVGERDAEIARLKAALQATRDLLVATTTERDGLRVRLAEALVERKRFVDEIAEIQREWHDVTEPEPAVEAASTLAPAALVEAAQNAVDLDDDCPI